MNQYKILWQGFTHRERNAWFIYIEFSAGLKVVVDFLGA
jgi:hypothetical protein